jgi:hypothetical protein
MGSAERAALDPRNRSARRRQQFHVPQSCFGDATLAWDNPLVDGEGSLESVESAIAWLRVGQERLHHSSAALTDDT